MKRKTRRNKKIGEICRTLCAAMLWAACMLWAVGCESSEPAKLKTSFKAGFECEYGDLTVKGKLSCCGEKLTSVSVDSPETLSGLSVEYKDGETQLSRDGLLCTADEAYLPQSGFPSLVRSVFSAADGAVFEGKDGDAAVYSLTLTQSTARLEADEDGFISKVSIDEAGFSLTLYDISEL